MWNWILIKLQNSTNKKPKHKIKNNHYIWGVILASLCVCVWICCCFVFIGVIFGYNFNFSHPIMALSLLSHPYMFWKSHKQINLFFLGKSQTQTYSSSSPEVTACGLVRAQVASSAAIRWDTVWYAFELSLSSITPWSSKSE